MDNGMAYVMLSRCASIDSIYLDNKFNIDKIVCDKEALAASNDLLERNIIPSYENLCFDFFMVNVSSLQQHINDLENDVFASKSKVASMISIHTYRVCIGSFAFSAQQNIKSVARSINVGSQCLFYH